MSANVLVALTTENKVFFSGRTRHLKLRELNLPSQFEGKVTGVGASQDIYYIFLQDGSFLCNEKLLNFKTNEYYGQQKLFRYHQSTSGGNSGLKISGKYRAIIGSANI